MRSASIGTCTYARLYCSVLRVLTAAKGFSHECIAYFAYFARPGSHFTTEGIPRPSTTANLALACRHPLARSLYCLCVVLAHARRQNGGCAAPGHVGHAAGQHGGTTSCPHACGILPQVRRRRCGCGQPWERYAPACFLRTCCYCRAFVRVMVAGGVALVPSAVCLLRAANAEMTGSFVALRSFAPS